MSCSLPRQEWTSTTMSADKGILCCCTAWHCSCLITCSHTNLHAVLCSRRMLPNFQYSQTVTSWGMMMIQVPMLCCLFYLPIQAFCICIAAAALAGFCWIGMKLVIKLHCFQTPPAFTDFALVLRRDISKTGYVQAFGFGLLPPCSDSAMLNSKMQPSTATYSNVKHSKIHPKFLNSNSTSHRWPFGAMAELLDNAMDPDVKAQQ